MQHNVGYAKNLGKEKRNQIPYVQVNEKSKKGKGSVPESPIGRGRSQDVTFSFVILFHILENLYQGNDKKMVANDEAIMSNVFLMITC